MNQGPRDIIGLAKPLVESRVSAITINSTNKWVGNDRGGKRDSTIFSCCNARGLLATAHACMWPLPLDAVWHCPVDCHTCAARLAHKLTLFNSNIKLHLTYYAKYYFNCH